ncbi:hypothetical protein ACIBBD_07160 [Streptomyces sp. NPDC051315]|uniref:hypothetical protein n=1 Tax=Streptomyces sp. NPDC051315 TaxID=3365650 RepID=UPI00379D3D0E
MAWPGGRSRAAELYGVGEVARRQAYDVGAVSGGQAGGVDARAGRRGVPGAVARLVVLSCSHQARILIR